MTEPGLLGVSDEEGAAVVGEFSEVVQGAFGVQGQQLLSCGHVPKGVVRNGQAGSVRRERNPEYGVKTALEDRELFPFRGVKKRHEAVLGRDGERSTVCRIGVIAPVTAWPKAGGSRAVEQEVPVSKSRR